MLNIVVRVDAAAANAALAKTKTNVSGLGGGINGLMQSLNPDRLVRWGKNLQWTGRQLEFAFTLPLVVAGTAATKWALDNDKAMTSVRKVYGDFTYTSGRVRKETDALAKSFELLSDRFGVAQSDVINIGAAWASAGAAGRALAEDTRYTLEAMILGEMDATQATQALISIMSVWHLSSKKNKQGNSELGDTLAMLNAIENQTAIRFSDLITVLQRSGGAARTAGVDIRHLAAFAASLVPAAGTAAQAGNALKTIFSRLQSPTQDTVDLLEKVGFVVKSPAWLGKSAQDKLIDLAKQTEHLSTAQKTLMNTVLGSRFQVNRLSVLFDDINNKQGNYARALAATSKIELDRILYQSELNQVLNSTSKRYEIMSTTIKNGLAQAIQPLLPAISSVLAMFTRWVIAFTKLSPEAQRFYLALLVILAALGPVMRYLGVTAQLFGEFGKLYKFLVGNTLKWTGRVVQAMAWIIEGFYKVGKAVFDLTYSIIKATVEMTVNLVRGIASWVAAQIVGIRSIRAAQVEAAAESESIAASRAAFDISAAEASAAAYEAAAAQQAATAEATAGFAESAAAAATEANLVAAGIMADAWATAAAESGIAMASFSAEAEAIQTFMASAAEVSAAANAAAAGTVIGFWSEAAAAQEAFMTSAAEVSAAANAAAAAETGAAWEAAAVSTGFIWTTAFEEAGVAEASFAAESGGIAAAVAGVLTAPLTLPIAGIAAAIATVLILWKVGFYDAALKVWGNFLRALGQFGGFIIKGIEGIIKALYTLPQAFVDAFIAVERVLQKEVKIILHYLSYLNPFARHSPSLVDNVKAGISTILDEYSRLSGIGQLLRGAINAHKQFTAATSGANTNFDTRDRAEQRQQILTFAPNAGPSIDAMYRSIDALKASLGPLTAEIDKQNLVVAKWQAAYDQADAAVSKQQGTVDVLQHRYDALDRIVTQATDTLQQLSQVGISGMQAMEDAAFGNEMAQKKLQLQIMKLEDAGGAVDDLAGKFSKLQGEIETVQGTETDLRLGGAGSEILGFYDNQLKSLKAQQNALSGQSDQLTQLNKQLDKLQRTGQELDLQKSINFDPQIRQIDQLVNGMKEMPFDEIIQKIQQQQAILHATQPEYDKTKAALDGQKAVLDDLTYTRDQINKQLDAESNKADKLNSAYSDIQGQISDMEDAMSGFASRSQQALQALTSGAQSLNQQLFDAGKNANFDIPGGTGGIEKYGGVKDINKFNDDLQKELDKAFKNIGSFDVFKPLKDKWNSAWKWIKDSASAVAQPVVHAVDNFIVKPVAALVGTIGRNFSLEGLKNTWNSTISFLGGVWNGFVSALQTSYDATLKPLFEGIGSLVTNYLMPVFDALGRFVAAVWNNVIGPAVSAVWNTVLKPIFKAIGGLIEGYVVPILQLWGAYFTIIGVMIGRVAKWLWGTILKGFFNQFSFAIIALQFIFKVFGAVVAFIWLGISNDIAFAWKVIQKVWSAMRWVIDHVLKPGFQDLKDKAEFVFGAIKKAITFMWDHGGKQVFDKMKWVFDHVVKPALDDLKTKFSVVFDGIKKIVQGAWSFLKGQLEHGLNAFIRAFNAVAAGVRAVARVLHIDVKINNMDLVTLAQGGAIPTQEVGSGFKTKGPRAIVGEGSKIHPEYVIPTDPRYKNRATKLIAAAAQDIYGGGSGNKPGNHFGMFAWGGILPSPSDVVNGIKNVANTLKKDALKAIFAGPSHLADDLIKHIPLGLFRGIARSIKNQVYAWVVEGDKDVSTILDQKAETDLGPYGKYPGKEQVMRWIDQAVEILGLDYPRHVWAPRDFVIAMRESGGNPRAINLWDSNAKKGTPSKGLMQVIDPTFQHYKLPGYDDIWNPVDNVIAADRYIKARYGDITKVQQSNPAQPPRGYALGGVIDAAMANGGAVLNRRHGGVLLHVAEGNHDEKVQVTPLNKKDDGGGGERHLTFTGDLVFPNVKNEKDAENFIRSLESLGT